jgi:hypothetical protein
MSDNVYPARPPNKGTAGAGRQAAPTHAVLTLLLEVGPVLRESLWIASRGVLFGQSVQRDVKTFLSKLRPDIQVVGDELIPLGKVKDFSSYVTKISIRRCPIMREALLLFCAC